jgi:glucose/arabinose dehydrogenase
VSLGLLVVVGCGGSSGRGRSQPGEAGDDADAACSHEPGGDSTDLVAPVPESIADADPAPDRPSPLPRGFTEQVVYSGLVRPTSIRFAKDGRVFVAEKAGVIKMFNALTTATPTVVADLSTEVHDYGDRGLLDIELDPGFPHEPYLYALYTLDGRPGDSLAAGTVPRYRDVCPDPKVAGCVVAGRLVKLTLSEDLVATNRSQTILVENWPQQFPSHSIGSLAFGPDGFLYVSAGDGASFEQVDYGDIGGNPLHEPPDAAPRGQRPPSAMGGALRAQVATPPEGFETWFSGKIIRVDPRSPLLPLAGRALPSPSPVVATGLRNPFRISFRPGAKELFIADVGWSTWEEIDHIADATDKGVTNFGWPCFEGRDVQPGYQAANLDLCATLYARPTAHTAPLFQYRRTAEVVAGDGCGTGSSAVSGIALYDQGPYPSDYEGALFFSDFGRKCIWVMPGGAAKTPDPTRARPFMLGAAQPVQLRLGLEHDLYYVDFGGTVRRIVYQGGNHEPRAALTATPELGPLPLAVTFDATGSADLDADQRLTYRWDLDGDGSFDDAEGATVTHTYDEPAQVTVHVLVTDEKGGSATAGVKLWPGHLRPTAVIDAIAPERWSVNDVITFSGRAFDGTGAPLPTSALNWSIVTHHCPDGCHEHALQQLEGVSVGSFRPPDHEYPVYLTLVLTVTDGYGLSQAISRRLDPNTVTLALESEPPGLALAVNGASVQTPALRTVIKGSLNSLSAPSQILDQTAYRFLQWSDRRGQTHSVTARATENRYAARFEPLTLTKAERLAERIITHTSPTEAGSPTDDGRERIRDGIHPESTSSAESDQYLTREAPPGSDGRVFVGYEFPMVLTFARLAFQEGMNLPDGGYFDTLGVEVRREGQWTEVAGLRSRPTYPGPNGVHWETFVLDFDPLAGDAIRLIGRPGGAARFVSVAELEVWANAK